VENISFFCKQKQQHLTQTIFNYQEGELCSKAGLLLKITPCFGKNNM